MSEETKPEANEQEVTEGELDQVAGGYQKITWTAKADVEAQEKKLVPGQG